MYLVSAKLILNSCAKVIWCMKCVIKLTLCLRQLFLPKRLFVYFHFHVNLRNAVIHALSWLWALSWENLLHMRTPMVHVLCSLIRRAVVVSNSYKNRYYITYQGLFFFFYQCKFLRQVFPKHRTKYRRNSFVTVILLILSTKIFINVFWIRLWMNNDFPAVKPCRNSVIIFDTVSAWRVDWAETTYLLVRLSFHFIIW